MTDWKGVLCYRKKYEKRLKRQDLLQAANFSFSLQIIHKLCQLWKRASASPKKPHGSTKLGQLNLLHLNNQDSTTAEEFLH